MSLPTTPRLPAPPSPRLALAISAALLAGYGSAHAATYPVTVSDDPGDGSVAGTLSHAIRAANLNPRADLIELQTDVTVKGVMKTLIDGAPSGGDHDTGGGDLILQSASGVYAIRSGPWKWIDGVPLAPKGKKAPTATGPKADQFRPRLINLPDDPGETKDVSATYPEIARQLAATLKHHRAQGFSRD